MRHFDADVEIIRSTPSKRAKMLVENLKNKLSNLKSQKTMHASMNHSRRNSRRITSLIGNIDSQSLSGKRPLTPRLSIPTLKSKFSIQLGKVDESLEDAQDTSASDRVRGPLKIKIR